MWGLVLHLVSPEKVLKRHLDGKLRDPTIDIYRRQDMGDAKYVRLLGREY